MTDQKNVLETEERIKDTPVGELAAEVKALEIAEEAKAKELAAEVKTAEEKAQKISFWRKFRTFAKKNGRIMIGGTLLFIVLFLCIGAPLFTKWDPGLTNGYHRHCAPGEYGHWLGADSQGRDLWARYLYGGRASIFIAVVTKIDIILTRILESLHAIPTILLLYVLVMIFGSNYFSIILAMSIVGLYTVMRFTRAQVLSLKKQEFVEREMVIGSPTFRTLIRHVLPHCSSYLLVRFGTGLGSNILTLATLSYLGVGLSNGQPTWGHEISDAQSTIFAYPEKVFIPMIFIGVTVFAFSMLGDGIRDYASPEYR